MDQQVADQLESIQVSFEMPSIPTGLLPQGPAESQTGEATDLAHLRKDS